MRRYLLALPLVILLLGADDAQKDAKKLKGKWTASIFEEKGKKAPEETAKKMIIIVENDTMVFHSEKGGEKATYKLDPSKTPKEIDFFFEDEKDKIVRGIYELDGDNWKLCWGWKKDGDSERPKEFASPADSDQFLIILKRAK